MEKGEFHLDVSCEVIHSASSKYKTKMAISNDINKFTYTKLFKYCCHVSLKRKNSNSYT